MCPPGFYCAGGTAGSPPTATLVFSHRVALADTTTSNYFSSSSAVLSSPMGNVSATTHKFSILSTLEALRRPDGYLHFVLFYPNVSGGLTGNPITGVNGGTHNEWVQTSNPTQGSPGQFVSDYAPININYPSGLSGCVPPSCTEYPFVGLKLTSLKQSANTLSVMTGCQTADWNYFEVGQLYGSACGNGICVGSWSVTWQQLYVINDASSISPCPAGKFASGLGATSVNSCAVCSLGLYSALGASVCTACPAGSYCPTASAVQACPVGTFSSSSATVCSSCPTGTFASLPGLSICSACPAGYGRHLVVYTFTSAN